MIMPIDIDKKEFSRDKRGYNSREVDEFLDLIVVDYEKLLNDNRKMAGKIKELEKNLETAQRSDTAMVETLQTAKKLMADIAASAERRAENMVRDAEIEADTLKKEAEADVINLRKEYKSLTVSAERIRKNLRQMLKSELDKLDGDDYGIFAEIEMAQETPEVEEKEEVPAKTLIFTENSVIEEYVAPAPAAVEPAATISAIEQELNTVPVSDLAHATISDLSEGLKKMAEENTSLDSTIILK